MYFKSAPVLKHFTKARLRREATKFRTTIVPLKEQVKRKDCENLALNRRGQEQTKNCRQRTESLGNCVHEVQMLKTERNALRSQAGVFAVFKLPPRISASLPSQQLPPPRPRGSQRVQRSLLGDSW